MKPRILLVNPPIYDFSAYDFWLKPYGMLRVAGLLRGQAEFSLFDFLDRLDARVPKTNYRADPWGTRRIFFTTGAYTANLHGYPTAFSPLRLALRRIPNFSGRRGTL